MYLENRPRGNRSPKNFPQTVASVEKFSTRKITPVNKGKKEERKPPIKHSELRPPTFSTWSIGELKCIVARLLSVMQY